GTCLTTGAPAVQTGEDVIGALEPERGEGVLDGLLVELVREVVLEGLVVDLPLTGTGSDTDAGHGLLATTGTGARAGRGGNIGVGRLVGLGGVLGGEFLRVLLRSEEHTSELQS